MSDLTEKDFKVVITNMFIELKESMVKEVKVYMKTLADQIQNINKDKLFFKKEAEGNPGVQKYSN